MAHNICGDSAARLPAEEVAPVKLFVLGNQVGENTRNPEKNMENKSLVWGESNALPRSLCFTCKVTTNLSE